MTPSHEEVLAAIDKARVTNDHSMYHPAAAPRNVHCDDLRATAERHAPETDDYGVTSCRTCIDGVETNPYWPCPDYQQVIDRLTAWGAL